MSALPVDEQRRGAGFTALDVLCNPPREDELTSLVELAARVCQTRMAAIILVDETEQHTLASVGFAKPATVDLLEGISPRDASAVVVVPDVRLDARFESDAWVKGDLSLVRFYASHRLRTKAGNQLGKLVLLDNVTGSLDVGQRASLATIVDRLVDLFELVIRTRELARTLAEMQLFRIEIEQSNERLSSFAGQVSHDLKTPLTSLALSLALVRDHLDEDGYADADVRSLLDRAIKGSARMADLIENVLDYARLGGALKANEVDLEVVVADVLVDLASAVEGVVIDVGPLPTVRGDAAQLRAVVQNLVANSAKFRDPARDLRISISARHVQRAWRVEVADNGRGVPPDDRRRVFEPLAGGEKTVDGFGIGLPTCRRIIGAHGGSMGLDPAVTEGATFWFELPD